MIIFSNNWRRHYWEKNRTVVILCWNITSKFHSDRKNDRKNENLEICITVWFEQLNESRQFLSTVIGLNGHQCKTPGSLKTTLCCHIFVYSCDPWWNSYPKNLNSCASSIFLVLEMKKSVLLSKIARCFDIAYTFN